MSCDCSFNNTCGPHVDIDRLERKIEMLESNIQDLQKMVRYVAKTIDKHRDHYMTIK